MIGSYLDKQVGDLKNGVLAAGSLLGIGLIIYFVVKKRKQIGAAMGIGKAAGATQVDIDNPPKQIEHNTDEDEDEGSVEIIDTDEEGDDVAESSEPSVDTNEKE